MPLRSQAQPRPDVTFIVSSRHDASKSARRVARQHASYWGHRKSRARMTLSTCETSSQLCQSAIASTEEANEAGNKGSDEIAKSPLQVAAIVHLPTISANFYSGTDFDCFSCLPQAGLMLEREYILESSSVNTVMLAFFGESFIRQTLLRDGESCTARYSGCHLLSYAYYLATTGKGTNVALIRLKGALIQAIYRAISEPENALSLDTMIAVMALGTPIVCELTNLRYLCSRPGHLTCGGSIASSMEPSQGLPLNRCERNAEAEYDMHYEGVTKLLRLQPDPAYIKTSDGRFVFLVKILSCAHRLLTLPYVHDSTWTEYFMKFELYGTQDLPDECWGSPLFGPVSSLAAEAGHTLIQSRCIDLTRTAREWVTHLQSSGGVETAEVRCYRHEIDQLLVTAPPVQMSYASIEPCLQYEAICLTVMLMTESVDRQCSLREARKFVPSAAQLPNILRKTDLLALWGELRGILYWIALVCHAALEEGDDGQLTSTFILAHFTQILSASDIPISAALTPIQKLLAFQKCQRAPLSGTTGSS